MSVFKFKQFEVNQSGCAMRINTDGVLLASMAFQEDPKRILDVGTGTGVIALMLAQRFPSAEVVAVEIDEEASVAAENNFKNSAFAKRLTCFQVAIQDFESEETFDLIVSNPPFFINDLKNEEKRKGIARHAADDFFAHFVQKAASLLTDAGKFWLVLPVKQADLVIELAKKEQLMLCERINLHSDETKPAFRQIIALTKENVSLREDDFFIYESQKQHTAQYKALLKDFFVAY
ncbi:tRNA1(Val) (adenine(37)-N6)-methyltransferase [Pedobacter sp. MW01-1-1]|uniref:tRNA1(Val) (adenine(37)-N6)-methyltransferase n=1 Tax=Pedobacter sp. MW01-1-1 TaxID=3383027 RepID=UPI003FEEF56D